jgi:hypothetical protein
LKNAALPKSKPPASWDNLRKNPHFEESLELITKSPEYLQWTEKSPSTLLWLHDLQDTGKTTTIFYIVKRIEEQNVRLASVIISRNYGIHEVTEVKLVASLIIQLFPYDEIQHLAMQLNPKTVTALKLWDLLEKLIENFKGEIVIIIDALDLVSKDVRSSFLQNFLKIQATFKNNRVLISSRFDKDIKDTLIVAGSYLELEPNKERTGKTISSRHQLYSDKIP